LIKWWLKCLYQVASDLTDRELELVSSYEEQFLQNENREERLTKRQMKVLEDIYKRRT